MTHAYPCSFCEAAGTIRHGEHIPVCAEHRAALRWQRSVPSEAAPADDPVLEHAGRAAMLAAMAG